MAYRVAVWLGGCDCDILGWMQVFRYWARVDVDAEGRQVPPPGVTAAAGWSDESPQAAQQHALERVQRFIEALRTRPDQLLNRYEYVSAIREPILEELHLEGVRLAALTRNGYGAVVLNAAWMFIADIDLEVPTIGQSLRAMWNRLRGQIVPTAEEKVIERVKQVVEAHRPMGVRLYRTAGGHRLIVTNQPFRPDSPESRELLTALGSDPLYVRLCEQQRCYRARLTPKPWRIGLQVPYLRTFPFVDQADERAMRDWVMIYESAGREWGVCELVGEYGETNVHPEIRPVLAWHDQRALGPRGARLA